MKDRLKDDLWQAIAALTVTPDGMLTPGVWSPEKKRLFNDCLNQSACELSHVRIAVGEHLMRLGFSEERALQLKETVARQMLGRTPLPAGAFDTARPSRV